MNSDALLGFDEFDANLSAARSPLFGEWALLAGTGIVSNGSTTAVTPIAPGRGFASGDEDEDDNNDEEEADKKEITKGAEDEDDEDEDDD